ncbi:hypothetical protein [Methylobacter sp. YRD-M1]|uniref:hypothetical protein n=1 Tax=Methylobacter sp. YRD-M1 TaxID=2911520 RepID=UPI00227D0D35|nr:hypothetical protein [Methylobacter sp. YRD-M1]WAK03773.1 hypothetical protein LZ558_08305 [Methylobacter sp. YRD-M1]
MRLLMLRNSLSGAMVYSTGDSIAALLTGDFQVSRLIGMLLLGGTLYAIEIPAYFAWLERRFGHQDALCRIGKALMAQAFFNPLWIARHMALIHCFSGRFDLVQWHLLSVGLASFVRIAPIGFAANYMIQHFIPLRWRFPASAAFSASMAVYYALSVKFFG